MQILIIYKYLGKVTIYMCFLYLYIINTVHLVGDIKLNTVHFHTF
jgi:hypothetical protein